MRASNQRPNPVGELLLRATSHQSVCTAIPTPSPTVTTVETTKATCCGYIRLHSRLLALSANVLNCSTAETSGFYVSPLPPPAPLSPPCARLERPSKDGRERTEAVTEPPVCDHRGPGILTGFGSRSESFVMDDGETSPAFSFPRHRGDRHACP